MDLQPSGGNKRPNDDQVQEWFDIPADDGEEEIVSEDNEIPLFENQGALFGGISKIE